MQVYLYLIFGDGLLPKTVVILHSVRKTKWWPLGHHVKFPLVIFGQCEIFGANI